MKTIHFHKFPTLTSDIHVDTTNTANAMTTGCVSHRMAVYVWLRMSTRERVRDAGESTEHTLSRQHLVTD